MDNFCWTGCGKNVYKCAALTNVDFASSILTCSAKKIGIGQSHRI